MQTWGVYLGGEKNELQKATATMKDGFETERLETPGKFAQVKAVQGSNSTQSEIVEVGGNC